MWLRKDILDADTGERVMNHAGIRMADKRVWDIKKVGKEFNTITLGLYATPEESMKRDYLSSVDLSPRKLITLEQLTFYADSLKKCKSIFMSASDIYKEFDSTKVDLSDSQVGCAEEVVIGAQKLAGIRPEEMFMEEQSVYRGSIKPIEEWSKG